MIANGCTQPWVLLCIAVLHATCVQRSDVHVCILDVLQSVRKRMSSLQGVRYITNARPRAFKVRLLFAFSYHNFSPVPYCLNPPPLSLLMLPSSYEVMVREEVQHQDA